MTDPGEEPPATSSGARGWAPIGLALACLGPGLAWRAADLAGPSAGRAAVFGLAIVGAAFLLSWAAEAAQLDIPTGLAVSVVALIAVLPEYAVDAVFAIDGGEAFRAGGGRCPPGPDGAPSPCSLALANMTGGNRLLIGVGWALVVLLAARRHRRTHAEPLRAIPVERAGAIEITFLALASAYALALPLRRSVTLVDTAVLVALYVAYTWRVARGPAEDPHLLGPAAWLGDRPRPARRAAVAGLLLVAAGAILLCADPFAQSLVDTGRTAGVDGFLLVQWLAPLASEAPELLVAGLAAWRLDAALGLSTLLSAKVNQWALLVGTLPVAFAFASGGVHGLPIGPEQRHEVFLTAAQSVFALSLLLGRSLTRRAALLLLGLFLVQLVAGAVGPEAAHGPVKLAIGTGYLAAAAVLVVRGRRAAAGIAQDGLRTPWSELAAAD